MSTRALRYPALWQSWWRVPLKLTAGFAATVFLALSFAAGNCYHCGPEPILELTLMVSGGVGLLGLLFGLGGNAGAKAAVGRAFNVRYLDDSAEMTRRVHRLSDELGLPRPAVGIMSAANAFAVGSTPKDGAVILGRPLIAALAEDELDAVIGHELGHIATGDMQQMQIACGYRAMFDTAFQIAGGVLSIAAAMAAQDRRRGGDAQLGILVSHLMVTLGRVTVAAGAEVML